MFVLICGELSDEITAKPAILKWIFNPGCSQMVIKLSDMKTMWKIPQIAVLSAASGGIIHIDSQIEMSARLPDKHNMCWIFELLKMERDVSLGVSLSTCL